MTSALLGLLQSHLFSMLGFLMGAALIARVLIERRSTQGTLAWMLAIILIPYVGVPLYLVFGGRKLRRQAARKAPLYTPHDPENVPEGTLTRMLCASGAPPPRGGCSTELLATGEEAYAAVIDLIDSARTSIHISTLILANDEVGRAVLERLEQRAREGIQVRLLLDALFRFRANARALRALRRAGGRFAWFMPVWHIPFRGHANLRLHRKIVVTDGTAALVGGMNLAREYMGPTPLPGRWRDASMRLHGPAVADLDAVFAADWRFASGETLQPTPAPPPSGETRVQVVGSGPDAASDLIYDAFLTGVFEARRRLWVATPYFVPDDALTRALILAVRRGVDVRVLIPARSNHRTADYAGASYLRQLAEVGATIACYRPGMMHAKIVLVDDTLGVLGSANFDMRSLFLDYEIALLFSSRPEIDALTRWFEALLPDCGALAPAGGGRILLESMARLVGPLE